MGAGESKGVNEMNWKAHMGLGMLVFGILYGLIAIPQGLFWGWDRNPALTVHTILIAVPLAVYASLLPDVDLRNSMGYALTILALVGFVLLLVFWGVLTAIMGLLAVSVCVVALLLPRHRGFMHSLGFLLLFSIGITILFVDFRLGIISFCCGVSHLVGDR